MRRLILPCLALCLGVSSAFAASPKVEAAIKVFNSVANDAAKLKTFCAMNKIMEKTGEKEDKAADTQIQGLMKQLGADFETAWGAGDNLKEDSADGKAFFGAMDGLMEKCK